MDAPYILVGMLLVTVGISNIMGLSEPPSWLPFGRRLWGWNVSGMQAKRGSRIIVRMLCVPIILWGLHAMYLGAFASRLR